MGLGVSQDYSKAANWYLLSAGQGYAPAQFALGFCYSIGLGVRRDRDEAIRWYKKAARQGDTGAQEALLNLGVRSW